MQNRFSLGHRGGDEVLEACEHQGLVFLPWQPLALGSMAATGGALARIAAAHGATVAQLALAWLLARSPVVLPFPARGRARTWPRTSPRSRSS